MLLYDIPYIILSYFSYYKLNYLANFRLYIKLFYFKLIYVISSYILHYSRSLYFMLL